ncbi:MAG: DinB family protein [Gemmatimonadaceae bacterium]
MQRQLSEIVKQFEHAQVRVDRLTDAVPDNRWPVRGDPDRWSVAECIAHLNLTSAAYIPRLRQAIVDARRMAPVKSHHYRRDPAGFFFSAVVGPMPTLGGFRIGRVKTPPKFVPEGKLTRQLVVAEFKRDQDYLIAIVREGDGMALDKVWIKSPFGERIRYNCFSALVILSRHEARHLDQAEAACR